MRDISSLVTVRQTGFARYLVNGNTRKKWKKCLVRKGLNLGILVELQNHLFKSLAHSIYDVY